jgi:small subunit ribosomal protein S5
MDNIEQQKVDGPVVDESKDQRPKRRTMSRPMPSRARRPERVGDEFEQRIVDLARVTRVMAGGKRMKFRACLVLGDKKGRVAFGLAKGIDVAQAISKAATMARKQIQQVPIHNGTIPHQVSIKLKSAKIMIKPAKKGSGIKAGGVVRTVLELAGIKDVTAKILGTNNKINNVRATLFALASFVPTAVARVAMDKNKANTPKFSENKVTKDFKPTQDKVIK